MAPDERVVDFHDDVLLRPTTPIREPRPIRRCWPRCKAPRGSTMRDIVTTIQAEQDAVIRLPLGGVVVIEGGPGTGKTAVALHRVAYLLYTHRERLARSGVLVVGPSAAFLRYVGGVLPALGESAVVFTTPGRLAPRRRRDRGRRGRGRPATRAAWRCATSCAGGRRPAGAARRADRDRARRRHRRDRPADGDAGQEARPRHRPAAQRGADDVRRDILVQLRRRRRRADHGGELADPRTASLTELFEGDEYALDPAGRPPHRRRAGRRPARRPGGPPRVPRGGRTRCGRC